MIKQSKETIKGIIKDLFPYNYSVVGADSVEGTEKYLKYLNFRVSKFKSGEEINGWKLPMGWKVNQATLKHSSDTIYNCIEKSPLGCAYLSPSFTGIVDKQTLIEHCAYRKDLEEAIVYDWTRLYRQGEKKWGLSVPLTVLNDLPESDIEVKIETHEYSSYMQVYDYLIEGETDEEYIISGHNCHPYQANDDISGCAVGIQIMHELKKIKNLHYSYRLLIGPELFGPMQWLKKYKNVSEKILGCILLKSVGNSSPIKMQKSYLGNTVLDNAGILASKKECENLNVYNFREYYGNDETVFDAYGVEIPTITFTRYPFVEYHTNLDTPEKIHESMLKNTENIVINTINIIENNRRACHIKKGLFCLSNPMYDLYKSAPEPGISNKGNTNVERDWNLMMNCLQRDLGRRMSVIDISLKYNIPYNEVLEYLLLWEKKGLIKLERFIQ